MTPKIVYDYPIIHHFGGDAYVREMHLTEPGMMVRTHAHKYEHLSYLAKGRAAVNCDGVVTEYVAPTMITIKKGVPHGILCLEPLVWLCIHGTNENDSQESLTQSINRMVEEV